MPLSPPVAREKLHTRAITVTGYQREDGFYDIEAQLTDTKTYPFENDDRGRIDPGEALHGMWMRLTVNEDKVIQSCEAATDYSPYAICPQAAPNFARLAGLRIQAGFLKAANERVGGPVGCTHLRELLQQMATVVIQTINPARARRQMLAEKAAGKADGPGLEERITAGHGGARHILNTCLAYGTDSPVIARRWPELYTGPREEPETVAPQAAAR